MRHRKKNRQTLGTARNQIAKHISRCAPRCDFVLIKLRRKIDLVFLISPKYPLPGFRKTVANSVRGFTGAESGHGPGDGRWWRLLPFQFDCFEEAENTDSRGADQSGHFLG